MKNIWTPLDALVEKVAEAFGVEPEGLESEAVKLLIQDYVDACAMGRG